MLASRLLSVLALGFVIASPGVAADDEAVVTAGRVQLPVAAEAPKADDAPEARAQVAAGLAELPRVGRIDRVTPTYDEPARRGRSGPEIHGEVGLAVGTGGYRSGYVSALVPLGENGMLGISVGKTDFGKNSVYGYGYDPYTHGGYDPYYGHGYGYGYGPGRSWRSRGGTVESLSLSLDMTGDARRSEACDRAREITPAWQRPALERDARGARACEFNE